MSEPSSPEPGAVPSVDPRQQRGLQIAATMRIEPTLRGWSVPSQSRDGKYRVTRETTGELTCSCPDFELRRQMCKHGFAVEFYLRRETTTTPDGTTTVTETRAMRVTYPQNSTAYNAAQTAERELFCYLLRDLCAAVPEPERGKGRPPVPVTEALFAATYKVFSTVSARRFMSDLRQAQSNGHVSRAWHFNSVLKVIENPDITPALQRLVTASAAPQRRRESVRRGLDRLRDAIVLPALLGEVRQGEVLPQLREAARSGRHEDERDCRRPVHGTRLQRLPGVRAAGRRRGEDVHPRRGQRR